MDEVARLLVLLSLAGVAVTVLAGVVRWRMTESRRIRRGLKAVLRGDVHGYLVALGRGKGIGFNFTRNQLAVVWDDGAWGYLYALDELMSAEVIIDGVVAGRVQRGEARRALDAFDAAERVALRLVFDDPSQPDFILDLWLVQDQERRDELPPADAIAEANRWLARIEALLRRPIARKRSAPDPVAAPVVAPIVDANPAREPPLYLFDNDEDEDTEDNQDNAAAM